MSKHNVPTHRPKPHVRKPRMYLDTKRKCCICGSDKTYDKIINRVQWHRNIDDNGKWTGEWFCNSCYHKDINQKRQHEVELVRKIRLKVRKDDEKRKLK